MECQSHSHSKQINVYRSFRLGLGNRSKLENETESSEWCLNFTQFTVSLLSSLRYEVKSVTVEMRNRKMF